MKNFKLLSALLLLSCAHVTLSSDLSNKAEEGSTTPLAREWQKFNITPVNHESIKMNCDDQSVIASYIYEERRSGMYSTNGFITGATEKSALLTNLNDLSRYIKFSDLSLGDQVSVTMELSPLCQVKKTSQSEVKATCENDTREVYFKLQKCIHDPKRKERQAIEKLDNEMRQAIEAQNFEAAIILRNRLSDLKARH